MPQNVSAPTLLVIVGLPGSGKTTLLEQFKREGKVRYAFDDYQFGPIKSTGARWRKEDITLVEGLKHQGGGAIADTRFCDPRERAMLTKALKKVVPSLRLEFIYFENQPELCQQNATRRKGTLPRHEINLIYYYTKLYKIPSGSKVLRVKTDWQ